MSELQAGMLALVVGCTKYDIDVGKIVKLDRYLRAGEHTPCNGCLTKDLWLATGENLHRIMGGKIVQADYGLYMTENLLPIKPEADPLDATHKEELHA